MEENYAILTRRMENPVLPSPSMPTSITPPNGGGRLRTLLVVAVIIVVTGAIAGTVYAYVEKMGPFASIPYAEDNLLSGLLEKVGTIDTSAYLFNASLKVEPRDADAKPFTIDTSNQAALERQYANDARRAKDISNILTKLVGNRYSTLKQKTLVFPTSLAEIANAKAPRYGTKPSVNDPVSKVPYSYAVTEGGKNFMLVVIFETKDAVAEIKSGYRYAATTTLVNGQTVTFTKDSDQYFYVPSEPPKPYFIQLQDMAVYLPPELSASFSLGATSDWTKKDGADWKFNVDATGDFGDLTYKLNVDAQKNAHMYYFRINNIPSLFGSIASYKGQWIKVDSKVATTSDPYDFDELSYAARQLPKAEERYMKHRAEFTDLLKKAVKIGDEEGLLSFKQQPSAERVDGRVLYRYDLQVNKDALLPFYKRMVDEAQKTKSMSRDSLFTDQGFVDYLQSKEFTDVFDYYQKNTTFTLWVDSQGYPAVVEQAVRFVPPDAASALKGKQAKIIFKLTLSDINEPVTIKAPADAKTIDEVTGAQVAGSPLSTARAKGMDASIQANLSSMRVQAEIYYDKNSQYGVAGTSCTNTKSFFSGTSVVTWIAAIEKANGAGTMVCNNTAKAYAVSSPLTASKTTTYWCVDSTGESSKRTTPLGQATVCPDN